MVTRIRWGQPRSTLRACRLLGAAVAWLFTGAWGVRSMRAVSQGADKAEFHQADLRAAAVLILIGQAVNG